MKLALALVGTLAGPALAAPQTLRMQWLESSNVHLADDAGAINHRRDGKVTVTLAAGGKLMATESGAVSDHNLYPRYSTTTTTAWSNTWRGRWRIADGALALELELGKRTCTKSKGHSDAAAQTLACDAVDQILAFACKPETVAVESAGGKRVKVAVWRCVTAGELADAPTTWTLGKTTCVRTLGGPGPDQLQPCT
ncbi:MAG: hypothetical protein WKG01_06240 [Kofleriaceae bacterium]